MYLESYVSKDTVLVSKPIRVPLRLLGYMEKKLKGKHILFRMINIANIEKYFVELTIGADFHFVLKIKRMGETENSHDDTV